MLVKYWILNLVDIGDGVIGLEDVQSDDFHTPGLNVLVGHSLPSSAYFQKRSTDFPLRFPEPIYPQQVEVSCKMLEEGVQPGSNVNDLRAFSNLC